MAVIDPRILSKTVKTMTPKKERVEEAQVRGTVVYQSGEHYIRLDGATNDSLTPVANIEEGSNNSGFTHGDRVLVLIKNHQAIVTKNLTTGLQANAAKDASEFTTAITDEGITADRIIANDTFTNTIRANGITADEIIAGQAVIDTLDSNYAHITNGVIDNAEIGYADVNGLDANFAHITDGVIDNASISYADVDDLSAHYASIQNGVITNATIDQADVNDLDTYYAHITNGVIDNADIDVADVRNLSANYAHISNGVIDNAKIGHADVNGLNANYAHVTNGVIDNAKIGYADVNNLDAHYAEIDLANVNNAWIQNGVIKNGAIADAQIIGVSANKLTAGTIDASNITVTNLNADNITTGTINGQRIGNGSIDLEKLSEEVPTKEYLDNVAENLQGQIDGQIETWTGTVVPTLNNAPASSWTTTSDRHKHVGDIYYVVNAANEADGYTYRFTESGSGANVSYSWTLIKDNQVTKALQDIIDIQGDITGIKQFDSSISSWKTDTDEELSSLKSRTSTLETDMGTKVSTTTFNELSQTVEENSASITSLSEVVETKADGSTVTTLSNTVNQVSQTATTNSSTISSLTTTLGTNADGTTKTGDIVHRTSAVEQDLTGFKSTVSTTYATKTELGNKADASTVYTKSEIDQKESAINLSVSAKADASSTAASLALKANKDTLTSEINASADTVKINANRLNITGVITAINNDSTTTIDGGKISTGTIIVGALDSDVQDILTNADNTLIYDHTYEYTTDQSGKKVSATFTAYVYKGGVDVKTDYDPTCFSWYLKKEDTDGQTKETLLGTGYTITVTLANCGYGAEIIGRFTTTDDSEALSNSNDNLTNANNENLTVRASGDTVRVRDLSVTTTIFPTDKIMVIGASDEHLVSVQTLQDYLNIHLDQQVLFNTTAGWNAQTSLVSDANTLYVYTDHTTDSNNNNVAGIKAGDGLAYVVDLPFIDAVATEHIADNTIHITSAERTAWNNKVRCYYAGTENLVFTTA